MDTVNKHKDHRKRITDKYREQGEAGFLTHQLLEMLLFYSIPRKDTNETAHNLLDSAASLEKLLSQPIERSASVHGAGISTALLVSLCGAIAKRSENESASAYPLDTSYRQSRYLFNCYKGADAGTVAISYLDQDMMLIETRLLCEGKMKSCDDAVYSSVKWAKELCAEYAILSHIHINGERMPSAEDIFLTESLRRALFLAECTLLEHYIVTDSDVVPINGLNNKSNRKDIDIK